MIPRNKYFQNMIAAFIIGAIALIVYLIKWLIA